MTSRNILLGFGIFIALALIVYGLSLNREGDTIQVTLGEKVFTADIADSALEHSQGLSLRPGLDSEEALLFVFNEPGLYGFWMKDMLFPIDIIWIDGNKKVVHIEHAVEPSTYPTSFSSSVPAAYVLEVRAGEAERLFLKIGDTVKFSKN